MTSPTLALAARCKKGEEWQLCTIRGTDSGRRPPSPSKIRLTLSKRTSEVDAGSGVTDVMLRIGNRFKLVWRLSKFHTTWADDV